MIKIYKVIFTGLFFSTISLSLFAQQNFFTDAGQNAIRPTTGQRVIVPQKYRSSSLDVQGMKNFLWSLPSERNVANRNTAPVLTLPMPDGSMAKFRVWESSIMEPGLAARFPEMRTFAGQGIDACFGATDAASSGDSIAGRAVDRWYRSCDDHKRFRRRSRIFRSEERDWMLSWFRR